MINVQETLEKIKALVFNQAPNVPAPAPAAPQHQAEPAPPADPAPPAPPALTLADGTPVTIDKMEVGGVVMIQGMPAPAGEHSLSDGTKLTVDANGVITAVAPAAPAEPEAEPDFSTPEAVQKAFAQFKEAGITDIATISKMVEALFQSVFGWQIRDAKEKEAIAAYNELFSKQDEKIKEQNEIIKGLFEVVEHLSKTPVADPAQPPVSPFNKVNHEARNEKINTIANSFKSLKK